MSHTHIDAGSQRHAVTSDPPAWAGTQSSARVLHWFFLVTSLFQGISGLEHALGYHMERHNVLSTNVAHVETPGFAPMDVERTGMPKSQDFGHQLSAAMTRTNPTHLPGGAVNGVQRGHVVKSPDAVAGMDGNSVSLDVEATKIAENQLRYEVVSALTSAHFRTLSYAASDGRR